MKKDAQEHVKKYGDATQFAREVTVVGCDLVAGYGGDGTQHEVTMGVLPGDTSNGFGTELGIPDKPRAAVE